MAKIFLFPFNKIPKGSDVILYGADIVGKAYLAQIRAIEYCNIVCFADKKFQNLQEISGIRVIDPRMLKSVSFEYICIAVKEQATAQSIMQFMQTLGIDETKIVCEVGQLFEIHEDCYDSVYSANMFKSPSYSQHGDDFVIANIFLQIGIQCPSYLDVGANCPDVISNTALLYRLGSRGIDIEANPALIEPFKHARPEDTVVNVGVGAEKGFLPFYSFGHDCGLNTFDKAEAERWMQKLPSLAVEKTMELPIITLQNAVDEYCNGIWPDFLDIDIEGLDYLALEAVNFVEDNRPYVICVEIREHEIEKFNRMLANKGYEPYVRLGENTIYLQNGLRKKILCIDTES